jgi:hypothetical protein
MRRMILSWHRGINIYDYMRHNLVEMRFHNCFLIASVACATLKLQLLQQQKLSPQIIIPITVEISDDGAKPYPLT